MTDAYPLQWPDGWPRTDPHQRADGAFKVSMYKALEHLTWEVERLGGRLPVISTNIPTRRDGMPHGRYNMPGDTGVAVYFEMKGQPYVFACDRYILPEHNVRAIGLTIEALRGVERWGASDMMQRAFTGFAAIAPPKNWRAVLGVEAGDNLPAVKRKFRELAKANHPDVGGDPSQFAEISAAWEAAQAETDLR